MDFSASMNAEMIEPPKGDAKKNSRKEPEETRDAQTLAKSKTV